MATRHSTHITDTRAVRKVIAALNDNWLIRSLEERDYGVDLALEIFRNGEATGELAMIQVKGTENGFKNSGMSFPTKTISYALLFQQPFFVLQVSLKDNAIRFLWLQRYADLVLDVENANWRKNDSVTLKFPAENDFSKNQRKLENILKRSLCRDEANRVFLALRTINEVARGTDFLSNLDCVDFVWQRVLEMERCKRFWDEYPLIDCNFHTFKDILKEMRVNIKSASGGIDEIEYANTDPASALDECLTSVSSAHQLFQETTYGNALEDFGDIQY